MARSVTVQGDMAQRRQDRSTARYQNAGRAIRARVRGFTLIELMIVVTVVAIISVIALPMFQTQMRQSRRADAKTALLDLAAREERYYTLNNQYTATGPNLGYPAFPVNLGTNATPDYQLSVVSAAINANNVWAFSLQAVPQGDQVNDTCGTYTLDNFGNQLPALGTDGRACW